MLGLWLIAALLVIGFFIRFIWPRNELGSLLMMLAGGLAISLVLVLIFLLLTKGMHLPRLVRLFALVAFMALGWYCINKGLNQLVRLYAFLKRR
ncbi:hypothetical protein [Phytobacter massiliensis]|uniref:hypothetical protein n=1 Tax=Phytobacter massiliensis TaxID=1485952 RepID=UPI0005C5D8A8|nr:hypothetical protein [Phytobacter massiliensis]